MTNEQQIINLLAFSVGIEEANNLWNDFKNDVRKKKKAPNTERAFKTLYNKLIALQLKGYDPAKMIELAYENGWKSVYEPNNFNQNKVPSAEQAIQIAMEPGPLDGFLNQNNQKRIQ